MITISLEKLTPELVIELTPLLEAHYTEISHFKDIPLKADWEKYFILEDTGLLKVFIARYNKKIIGYVAYTIGINMHYSDVIQAIQDVLFVSPDNRGKMAGIKLLKESEKELKKLNVKLIVQHVKLAHDFSPMLKRLGYEDVEKLLIKRVG